jgi:uncharacterized membrane protein YphA (DoxX/SURF4 family)
VQRSALGALWLALLTQLTWFALNGPTAYGVTVTAILLVFAVRYGRWLWLTVVVRMLMSAGFLLSVADRLGLLGGPGTSGTSWGDFEHFVDYTRSISTFLPASWATTLAVLATAAESTLGLALLLGAWPRLAALGAAALLLVFGVSMTLSVPAAEQFHYCVFPLAAGMLLLSTSNRYPLSLTALTARIAATRRGDLEPTASPTR